MYCMYIYIYIYIYIIYVGVCFFCTFYSQLRSRKGVQVGLLLFFFRGCIYIYMYVCMNVFKRFFKDCNETTLKRVQIVDFCVLLKKKKRKFCVIVSVSFHLQLNQPISSVYHYT